MSLAVSDPDLGVLAGQRALLNHGGGPPLLVALVRPADPGEVGYAVRQETPYVVRTGRLWVVAVPTPVPAYLNYAPQDGQAHYRFIHADQLELVEDRLQPCPLVHGTPVRWCNRLDDPRRVRPRVAQVDALIAPAPVPRYRLRLPNGTFAEATQYELESWPLDQPPAVLRDIATTSLRYAAAPPPPPDQIGVVVWPDGRRERLTVPAAEVAAVRAALAAAGLTWEEVAS